MHLFNLPVTRNQLGYKFGFRIHCGELTWCLPHTEDGKIANQVLEKHMEVILDSILKIADQNIPMRIGHVENPQRFPQITRLLH
jgi:hypothetical protein